MSNERRRTTTWQEQDPAHVLLIDDDPAIHSLVTAMLKSIDVQVTCARDATGGIEKAMAMHPDLVLLDHELPDTTGVDVLARLKSIPQLAEVPVIVVTATERREVLTACFAGGASDYLRKPFFGAELRARVQSVIDRQRMVAALGRAAHVDPLTGLPNRTLLNLRLQAAVDRTSERPDYGFAVMFLDFDRFKIINDSLGHEVGDALLRDIAQRLRENVRAQDTISRDAMGATVARLGGDEFVIVLEDVADVGTAVGVAERLLESLEEPYRLGEHTVRSSASIGIVHSGAGYDTAEDMLRDADIAMYEAKSRGRNCYAVFTPFMREAVRNRLRLENALRDAIGTDQLYLVYQPIVSLETRQVESVEALLRWRHPELGLISPQEFIPIAEETRLILPLADDVLRRACRQFLEWRERLAEAAPHYVSVNLSRVQLADPALTDRLFAILEETGMPPDGIQLEVTESQLMQHHDVAADLLGRLKQHGIRLAMDDFGTGYSSLSCLQEYPFDVLKVDRALTENVSRGRGYSALLHAVMTLAENLGLDVVAEGIETMDQLVLLQALECPFGQGYLLSRPLEADALEAWCLEPSPIGAGAL